MLKTIRHMRRKDLIAVPTDTLSVVSRGTDDFSVPIWYICAEDLAKKMTQNNYVYWCWYKFIEGATSDHDQSGICDWGKVFRVSTVVCMIFFQCNDVPTALVYKNEKGLWRSRKMNCLFYFAYLSSNAGLKPISPKLESILQESILHDS